MQSGRVASSPAQTNEGDVVQPGPVDASGPYLLNGTGPGVIPAAW